MKAETGPPEELKVGTKKFPLRIIRPYSALPKETVAQVLGKELFHSGALVGAHYRAAYRGKSHTDFIGMMEGALQARDGIEYWLALLAEAGGATSKQLQPHLDDASELSSIAVTIIKRTKDG
jgi:four helix bundle protein